MSNEWCDITVRNRVLDLGIDHIRKERDAALKKAFRYIHNAGRVLYDRNLWRGRHLANRVEQAIDRNSRV